MLSKTFGEVSVNLKALYRVGDRVRLKDEVFETFCERFDPEEQEEDEFKRSMEFNEWIVLSTRLQFAGDESFIEIGLVNTHSQAYYIDEPEIEEK